MKEGPGLKYLSTTAPGEARNGGGENTPLVLIVKIHQILSALAQKIHESQNGKADLQWTFSLASLYFPRFHHQFTLLLDMQIILEGR